jgi:hypothetical protein
MLHVMLNRTGGTEGIASWGDGELRVSPDGGLASVRVQLVAERGKVGVKPAAAVLVFDLLPWRGQFVGADGLTRTVQTFRYETVTGSTRFLCWCGACGHVAQVDLEELADVGVADCPKCGAVCSHAECRRWHNWGGCLDCGGCVESSRVADLAEDRQHPKAGPSAPSLGSCKCPGCTQGLPLVDCEAETGKLVDTTA